MKYKKILVPLDGSKLAEGVLPYARLLANGLRLPVDLLHVNDPETVTSFARSMQRADYLKEVAASFPTTSTVNFRVEKGRAAEVIVDSASGDAGTLIAMATYGRSGARRWLLGSVAHKVLQAAVNPLLLIRPNPETVPSGEVWLSTVIVPLDGSHLAPKIFPHVVYLAKRLTLGVVLIRTYTLPTTAYFVATGVSPAPIGELGAKIKEEIADYLRAKVEELKAEGVENVSFVAVEGKGPEEIIDLAERTSHNLVVMSTHGRSGMGRWVLGSVTERVVCYCGDPVLVIRPAAHRT
ncbi:MAG: universal stress protein [Deltaproteobacteria bacterium]|nr:universal stress protein [Deltaproteobacteria bacterium]